MLQCVESLNPAATMGEVRVYNETTHAVTTIVTTVIPLAEGEYRGGSSWRATGATSTNEHVVHEQVGLAWPDGSWRYARVHFRCDCPASTDKLVTIQDAQASPPTFTLHADVLAALQAGYPWFRLYVGQEQVDLFDQPGVVTEANGLVQVVRFRGRVPNTPFWAELYVQFHTDQRHARWWLHFGNSWIDDPLRTSPEYTLPGDIDLFVRAASCWVRHESIAQDFRTVNGADTTIRLVRADESFGYFPDGHSQVRTGVLQFGAEPLPTDVSADAETWRGMATADVQAVESDWRTSEAFGAFGYVPTRPPWIPDEATFRARAVVRAARDYVDAKYSARGPWSSAQYGCGPRPQAAGAQNDFGITRHTAIAMCGHPAGLKAAQRSAYQEACRPSFFRFADMTPWAMATRPTFFWQGRPHRDSAADHFGKNPIEINNKPRGRNEEAWEGMDREHYGLNHLTFYALLTGDLMARELCRYRCELWMAEHTYTGSIGNHSLTNGFDAARAIGRSFHTAANLLLVTGRTDFRTWVSARFQASEKVRWTGADNPNPPNELMGLHQRPPNPSGHLLVWQFFGWEEFTGCEGLMAWHTVHSEPDARPIVKRVSQSMIRAAVLDIRTTWQRLTISPWVGGTPAAGATVTQGGASGIIAFTRQGGSSSRWDLLIRNCTGTFTTGTVTSGASTAGVLTKRDGFSIGADVSSNGFRYHTAAQYYELEPGVPHQQLRHFLWHGNSGETSYNAWTFGGVLLTKLIADEDGDTATQVIVDPIVEFVAGSRSAPGDGFVDTGEAGLTEWSGVVEDPFA